MLSLSASLPRILTTEPALPAEPAIARQPAVPALAQAARGSAASSLLSIGVLALILVPACLAIVRLHQLDTNGGSALAKLWVLARFYMTLAATGMIIGSLAAGTVALPFLGACAAWSAICYGLAREIGGRGLVHWPPLPGEDPVIHDRRIRREPAPPFPAALPTSEVRGWRRNNEIMRGDGGSAIAHSRPTAGRVQQACTTLRFNLIRCLGGPQAEQFTDPMAAQTWLDRQPNGPLRRACGVLDHIADQPAEILIPLVEAADRVEEVTRVAQQERRSLNPAERELLVPGLAVLREGFQGCSGAWAAHLPMALNLLRNDQIEPRNWILRLFAQERLDIVTEYFREQGQQVHYINQMRYELWTRCRIALPGAASTQSDWFVGDQDHSQARQQLAWTIHTLQNPAGLASSLRAAINRPTAAVVLQQLQAEISRSRMQSGQARRELQSALNLMLTQAQRAPSEADPAARQRELEAQLATARDQLVLALHWGALAEDLLRASPERRAAAREALLACPGTPDSLQGQLRSAALEVEGWEACKTQLERALARAEMTQPAFRQARGAWRTSAVELAQLRRQIEALRPLHNEMEAQELHRIMLPDALQRFQRSFQLVRALSDQLEEARLPSLWQLLQEHPQPMRETLQQWIRPGSQNFQQLREVLTTQLLARYVEVNLSSWFQNDQLTEVGSFEVLGHYNFLMRTERPA